MGNTRACTYPKGRLLVVYGNKILTEPHDKLLLAGKAAVARAAAVRRVKVQGLVGRNHKLRSPNLPHGTAP